MAINSTIRTFRSRDISESIPLNVGQPTLPSDVWYNTTVTYDIAVGGLPFFYSISDQNEYLRQTADYQKEQFDNSAEPGEQSLTGWWIRSQSSFHNGAGIRFFDPSSGEPINFRFKESEGVNVFNKGEVSLLKDTFVGASPLTSSITHYMIGAKDGNDDCILFTCGNDLKKLKVSGDSASVTIYGNTASAGIEAITTDGTRYFIADGDHIRRGAISGSAVDGNLYNLPATGEVALAFVKQRLVVGEGASIHEGDANRSLGNNNLPTALYTHPNPDWRWTAISETGNAILCAGYAGSNSAIFKFVLQTTSNIGQMPTLSQGVLAAEMPVGEKVTGLFYYLGKVVIGTTKGVRVASIDADSNLTYGPLLFKISQEQGGVRQFVARDRFVWCASGISTPEYLSAPSKSNIGLVRIDLSNSIAGGSVFEEGLIYAYANDLEEDLADGITYGVAHFGNSDRLAFLSASNIYIEKETELRESGYITTGAIRYGTLEPKNFKRIRARGDFDLGSMDINTIDKNDVEYSTFTYNAEFGSPEVSTPNPVGAQEFESYRFILNRDTTVTASGPVLKGYQAKALPATPRQKLVSLPVFCYDVENDRYNNQVGYEGRAIERLIALENLEAAGDEVFFQDFTTNQSGTCTIEKISFERMASPDKRFDGFGGKLTILIRLL